MMTKKKSIRSDCSTYLAKSMAFMELGRMDEARQWADMLQRKLIELGLLVDIRARVGDNT